MAHPALFRTCVLFCAGKLLRIGGVAEMPRTLAALLPTDTKRQADCILAQVIIAGAGGAAHLPGMVAALTPLPVVGVPVVPAGAQLGGIDALLSIVQARRPKPEGCLCGVDPSML